MPKNTSKVRQGKKEVANFFLIPSKNLIFQVNYKMDCITIDMGGKTCTCRKWDMSGIPCYHAVSCIFFSLV